METEWWMDWSREASATVQGRHSEDLTEGAAVGTRKEEREERQKGRICKAQRRDGRWKWWEQEESSRKNLALPGLQRRSVN